jgi:hypothetical protein
MRLATFGLVAAMAAGGMVVPMQAQTAAPKVSGVVKATNANGMTVTGAAGDVAVTVGATARVLLVDPKTMDVKSATAGSLADVTVGDKAIVTGTPGDPADALNATRVYLLKAAAIAQSHAAEDAAWASGLGGIVKSSNADAGTIVIASGMKTITVTVTPKTVIRHYSGTSVKFADATMSNFAAIRPGDQLRVRGVKAADGSSIVADEMVAGTFHNYSGLIASIDSAAGTVTLKDLASKKTVTVAVTANSDVRRIPAQMAQMVAARMKGGAAGAPAGATPPAGDRPAGAPGGGYGGRPGGYGGAGGGRTAGSDLSSMLSRLPTETLSGLKVGDAVMIVATEPGDGSKASAVTLLAGVDAILTASPTGEMTLSPWSIGGGGGEGGGEGGPQ